MAAPHSPDRPAANFSPSLWGDLFLKHTSHAKVYEECYKETEVLKNEVRSMLSVPSGMVDTMELINTIERLGISYHFQDEIQHTLSQYFNLNTKYDEEAYDLHTVSLHFRLFRQHGYRISSDIFGKWMNGNGKFKDEGIKSDAKGLLSLYEACYLRTHGDTLLDYALDFATANLKSMLPNLGSPLGKQVARALAQPLHLGTTRIDERHFISMYEEFEHKNETLLRFSKLDFNLLQELHRQELKELSRWWRELNFCTRPPYARDRLVECFFWATGVYHEPHFSRARIMLTKTIALISVADDIYDAYGNINELNVLTQAMERWDIAEIDRLPDYIVPFYKATLELYKQFNEELFKEGRSYATNYAIAALKELVRCYHVEAKWFIKGTLPTFEEYLNTSLITCTYCYLATTALLGMESITKQDFEWLSKKPKILVAALKICRFIDDIGTYEVEKERGQIATGIECYMKENGVTKEEAIAKFYEFAENAWKDMNEECLRPFLPSSRDVLLRILNLGRLLDVTYKNGDGYTHPEKGLKPHIIALFVDQIN